MTRVVFWLLAALLAPWPALASKPRVRLERLDASQLADGKLRVYASVIDLEGTVVDGLGPDQFSLIANGRSAGHAEALQRFSATNEEVYVVFVIEVAAQYKKALEPVKEALKEFIEDQPRQFKAMLIAYGSEIEPRPHFESAAALANPIDDLNTDDDSADVQMVGAVRAGFAELQKIKPKDGQPLPRRLLVLISDGLNFKMDRQTFKTLGDEARKLHLPIHSIAFSPGDERGPLLNLGELSKRSNGTFRWAPRREDLKAQLGTLADEVRKQYVLTFKAPFDTLQGHSFAVRQGDLTSNRVNGNGFDESGPGQSGRLARVWPWLFAALAALVLLYLFGLYLQSRGVVPKMGGKPLKPAAKPVAKGDKPPPDKRAAPPRATLIAIGGALAGNRFEIAAALSVGKAPGQSITIAGDPTVSSRHCEFSRDGTDYHVKDLGSTNGTFVNNQRVAPGGLTRIADGDIVRLGAETQFKVRID